jgi:retron-type reverse transcriptase
MSTIRNGGVISPLLANIFLHELDRQFYGLRGPAKAVKAKLVRYADGGTTHSVRWTALKSGGLKSLWLSDEGSHIQKRG